MQRGINLRSKDSTDPVQFVPFDDRATTRLPQLESTRLYRRNRRTAGDAHRSGCSPPAPSCRRSGGLPNNWPVSRTSVREALYALEVTGRVVIRQGHGVQILLGAQRPAAQNPSASGHRTHTDHGGATADRASDRGTGRPPIIGKRTSTACALRWTCKLGNVCHPGKLSRGGSPVSRRDRAERAETRPTKWLSPNCGSTGPSRCSSASSDCF